MDIVMAERKLNTFFQHMGMPNYDYKSQLDTYVTVLEAYCGRVSLPQIFVDTKLKELPPLVSDVTAAKGDHRTAAKVPMQEQYLACTMLVGENAVQFSSLKDDLFNSYLIGRNKHPKTREYVVGLMHNYKVPKKQHQHDK